MYKRQDENHRAEIGQRDFPEALPGACAVDGGGFIERIANLLQTGQHNQHLHAGIPQDQYDVVEDIHQRRGQDGGQIFNHLIHIIGIGADDGGRLVADQLFHNRTADNNHREEEQDAEKGAAVKRLVEQKRADNGHHEYHRHKPVSYTHLDVYKRQL